MISYDNYKNRIEKLAKAKRVLHKFRFLICGVLALLVGASVGLMCAKGAYMSDMSLSAQTVKFNEPYEVTAAKAFLASPSEQYIEYRGESGDWTREKPVKAGKYSARTVTKKIVGYSYSSEVSFEIEKLDADFNVKSGSVTYGEIHDYYSVPQLISGHRVDESVLVFDYGSYGAATTTVEVDLDTVKIIDENGDDFTDCYNITPHGNTLSIRKRNISVTPLSYEFEYDGQPHVAGNGISDRTLERLVNGDTITITTTVGNFVTTFADGVENAGEYIVRPETVTIKHGDNDVSGWYYVNSGTSRLTVTPRVITVYTGNAQKEYDGEPAENTNVLGNNLVEGHKAYADRATLPDNPNVGTYANKFDVTVRAADGVTDLSDNYQVDEENSKYGTLTVNPAKLTVTTGTPEAHTYDGKPFTYFDFEVEEMLADKFTVTAVKRLSKDTTDAGEYLNDFEVAVKLNGSDVTGNFDIKYTYGKLTVNKRNMTVLTGSDRKVYDGTPLVCDNPVINGIVPKHRRVVAQPFSVINATGEDGVKNDIRYTVYDEHGKDVGYNYVIEHTSGTLFIDVLQISVETETASREYDGTPFSNADYVATRLNADGEGLYGTDTLDVTFVTSRTDAGSEDNVCAYRVPTYDGARSNYRIVGEVTYGTLTVEAKELTVKLDDITAVYGEDLEYPGYNFELVSGQSLDFETHFENADGETCTPEEWQGYTLLDVGEYSIVPNPEDWKITGGSLSNYDIKLEVGTLKITQRVIYYVTADDTKIYDGTALENTDYETYLLSDNTKAGLLKGDELSVLANATSIVEVQKRPNANYYNAPNGNYYIDTDATVFGWLEVTPRPIIVYTADDSKTYDATPLINTDYAVKYAVEEDGEWVADESEVGLVEGDELTRIGNAAYITDSGKVKNTNAYENANYSVKKYVYGTLTVEKIKLGVKYKYDNFTRSRDYFDRTDNSGISYDISTEDIVNSDGSSFELPDGQKLRIFYKIVGVDGAPDVGSYTVTPCYYEITKPASYNPEYVDAGATLRNYEITCPAAQLEVGPTLLSGNVLNRTVIYGDSLPENLSLIDRTYFGEKVEFEYAYDRDVKDVGDYVIFITGIKVYDKDGNLMPNGPKNYDYSLVKNGRLAVISREITVQLKPLKNVHYGEELPEIGYDVTSGTVVDGDELRFDYVYYLETADNTVIPKDHGAYGIAATAAYLNDGEIELASDAENYNITVVDGQLVISRVLIGVQLEDITVNYGDNWTYPAENPNIIVGQLYYGETLEVAVKYVVDGVEQSAKPRNVGSYEIVIDTKNSVFYNQDGSVCGEGNTNYVFATGDINGETGEEYPYNGTLTINKKKVRIKLTDITRTYGFVNAVATESNYERTDGSDEPVLAYDEVLWVLLGYKDGEKELTKSDDVWRLSAGDYSMYAAEFIIGMNVSENALVQIIGGLDNYDIVCEEGNLTVEPYAVTVKPNDQTCVYGTPVDEIQDTGFEYTDSQTVGRGGLPYGEELQLTYSYEPSPLNGVGEYKVKAAAAGVKDGDLKNYAVSYEDGTLTVIARTLFVVLDGDNETTYGTAPEEITYKIYADVHDEVVEVVLPEGDTFVADFDYYKYGDPDKTVIAVRNAGEYGITAYNERVETSAGETSDNYILVVVDGKLTVNKKTVTVELNQIDLVYYGETFTYAAGVDNYANFNEIELAYDERLEVAVDFLIDGVVGTPKYVDFYQRYAYSARLNDNGCVVYESDGETVVENGADNYNFICEDIENLHILTRTVRIRLNDISDVQYGDKVIYPDEPNNFKSIENLDDDGFVGLPYGELFKVRCYYEKDGRQVNPVAVGTYSISATSFNTIVYESDGVTEVTDGTYDGSYNYNIIIEKGTLEIVPREITVKLSDYEKEYGDFGNTFVYPEEVNNYDLVNSDALAYDEQIKVDFKYRLDGEEVTPRNVGVYDIVGIDYTVYDGEEIADKNNYIVNFEDGTLEITRKRINVKLDEKSCTYGDELPENTYVIIDNEFNEYTLPYNDKLEVLEYSYWQGNVKGVTPRNAGLYEIHVTEYSITNGEDDVKSNYTVNACVVNLTIEKADLKLQLIDVENAAYGDKRGYPSGKGNFDAEKTVGIKYDDQLELAVEYEVYKDMYKTGLVTVGDKSRDIPVNAARYYINLVASDSVIHTTEGEQFNLELNYNVECENDLFVIFQRRVRVEITVPEYTYGETVEKPAFTIEVIGGYVDQSEISTTELPYNEGMPDFDFGYVYEDGNVYYTPVNAGEYRVELARKYVQEREDLAGNYSFYISNNYDETLTINKKQIEITLDDMTAQYGDFEYNLPETHTFTVTAGELAYSDELTVYIGFTEVGGESLLTFAERKYTGLYSIVATEYSVDYSEEGWGETASADDLLNYEIVCNRGTLEIVPKQLHVAISRDVKVEYGQPLPEEIPYSVSSNGEVITELPYGDNLAVAYYYLETRQPVNAGTYTIAYDGAAINLKVNDANYSISGENGLLTIEQKKITVTVYGGTAVYGYTQLPEIRHEVTDGELLSGENLSPAYKFSLNGTECNPINAGEYDISVDEDNTTVVGGNALYENYSVTYVYEGKLVITKSPLMVEIIGDSFTYGERAIGVTFKITAGELYHGDELELTYTYINKESGDKSSEPTAAGTYAIKATAAISGGNARVENYDISYDDTAELEILQRAIEISFDSSLNSFGYGEDYDNAICAAATVDGTLSGHTVEIAVTYSAKTEAASARMLRARSFAARAAQGITPKDAGTYIASLDFENCTVTDADGNPVDGGINNYVLQFNCEDLEFVIERMALTVNVSNADITYGDTLPTALGYEVEEQMPYGESLELTFSFAGDDNKLPVHADTYPVKITEKAVNGGSIDNYTLTFTNGEPTLTIAKKSVSIRLSNLKVPYGTAVEYGVAVNNYNVGASDLLVDGDELTVTEVSYVGSDGTEYTAANAPQNAGLYDIVYVSCTVVNAEGEDATNDYTVSGLNGVLTIDSSVIIIYTGSAQKEYDGTPLSTDEYDGYEGDLLGYRIVVDENSICERIDATTGDGVDNTTRFKIVDENGDETDNLELRYGADNKTYGKLKVLPKYVEVTIDKTSAVYGVQPTLTGTTSVPLAEGEYLEFDVEYFKGVDKVEPDTAGGFFILPVGKYSMYYLDGTATISGGRGKASNYDFEFVPAAQFEVTHRHIAVTTADGEDEYSGSEFSKPDGYATEWVLDGERTGKVGLLGGEGLEVVSCAKITEVGSTENVCVYSTSGNYVIEAGMYDYGTLTVTEREIMVKTADIVETYDGTAKSGGVCTDVNGKLVEGHRFVVVSELVSRTDVTKGVVNELTVVIKDGDKDVTANYKIKYDYGTIIVNPRPIAITTGGVSGVVYDGWAHGNTEYEEADGLLTELDHELVVDNAFTYTNATEGTDNETTYKIYCGLTDLTHNYDITYICGKIVIDKKPVTVTLNANVSVEYGEDYETALTQGAVSLIDGETVKLAITTDAVNSVGVYTASVDWANSVVSNGKGVIKNGAANYAPEFVPASVQFEIVARNITVTLNAGGKTQFTYGENYDAAIRTATVDSMVNGEKLNVAVNYNVLSPKNVGEYTAELDWAGCTVTGGDKTNYNVLLCNDVDFEIVAKELVIDMDDIEVGFGEPLVYPDGASGYKKVDGLAYGDTLTSVIPAFEKDGREVTSFVAGEYDIVCDGIVINGGDGTANYTFKTGKSGTLTVTGIGIEIVRKTVTKIYDGEPLALSENAPETEVTYITADGKPLPAGYSLVLDGAFATKDGNVSSSCANTAKYKVLDGNGNEAGEYVVSYQTNDARLEIYKKVINVTTETPDARPYDGTPLTAGCTYDEEELVDGHVLKTSNQAKLTDAGSIPNTMDIAITANGVNVTANYDIRVTEGTLTVDKLPFTVEISDMSRVYGEELNAAKLYPYALINGEKLLSGLKFTKDGEPCDMTKLLDVGEYDITGDTDNMSVTGGKLSNYVISFKEGAKLTVTERHIIITTASATAEYSGNPLTKTDGYTTEWIKDGVKQGKTGLLGGDVLEVVEDSVSSQTEIGSTRNECEYTVSANYVIESYVYGTLTVTRIAITVTTNNISGEYNGTAYSDGGFTYDDKLLDGHEIAVSGSPSEFLDAVQGAENEFEVVITAAGSDVTGYYEINYVYGKVNISKCALTITLNGAQKEFEYGDDSFDGKFKQVTVDGLVGGDELTNLALRYSTQNGNAPVNAGKYTAKFDLINSFIKYAGEGNGIGNYEITCAAVDFEITRKVITVTLGNWADEEYDGNTHAFDKTNYEIADDALVDGEIIANFVVKYCSDEEGTTLAGTPKDAGTYYVFLDLDKTLVRSSTLQTQISTNYDVSCAPVKFVITPKKLIITLSNVTHTYDGEAYDFASGDGLTTNLCDGDTIGYSVSYDETPVNAGTYTVTLDRDSLTYSDNYVLDEASKLTCTLEIEKREITVKVKDRNVERGNEEYTKADLIADFVEGDLNKATVSFTYTDKLPLPVNTVACKTVTVTLSGDVMDNYTWEVVDGTLTVTERKVLVKPVFNGNKPYVYDGNAVDLSDFGYSHVHNVTGAAADDKYGFTAEDAANFTATYTFKDKDGNTLEGTPVNAGRYTVKVTLTGDGINGYLIEYADLTFIIEQRPLSYTVEVEGAGSYVYSNSRPAFSAQLTEYDGFVNGLPENYTFELFDGDEPVTRYNVGTYQVKLKFEGMENYDITATSADIKITRRVLVVTPSDPYGGEAQTYNGTNLTLEGTQPNVLGDGLAADDELTIESTEFAPTSLSGKLTISGVNITGGGVDVSQNYTVYYVYDKTNTAITSLGLRSADFQVRVSYEPVKISYTLGDVSKTIPYTGAKYTYEFNKDGNAVRLSDGQTLGYGHRITVSQDTVTVPAEADVYEDLITKLVCVVDGNGKKLAIYTLECDNPENGIIKVAENVISSVDLSGITVSSLTNGEKLERSVTFEEGATVCSYELFAFNLDGEWLIGVTLFSESSAGRKTDLSANYKLDESCTLEGATVKIITLAEAEEYARPAIGVNITVTESALESGRGTVYSFDGESRWVLNGGYTVDGAENLQEGHQLQVLVFRENGKYLLGVTVYRVENGARKDVSTTYRLKELVKSDVEARYITTSEAVSMQRELYVDFSGAFNDDGTPKVDENGMLLIGAYSVEGLDVAESHIMEVAVTENEDGTYTFAVVVYQLRRQGSSYRKYNMASRYELKHTAPAGVTVVSGTLN